MDLVQLKIIEVLDEIGCAVPNVEEGDFAIIDYIPDSLSYMLFYMNLEERLDIRIPDELFKVEYLQSYNGFANAISSVIKG